MLNDSKDIAESFNNYFCNVAEILADQVQQSPVPCTSFMPEPMPYSFFLRPTTLSEIQTIIKDLKITSPGFDNISIKVIKKCSNEISPFLVHIINSSFKEGCFPQQLQIAKVTRL